MRRFAWRLVAAVLNRLLDACDALGRWEPHRRSGHFDPQDRERIGL